MNTQSTRPNYQVIVDELIKGCMSESSAFTLTTRTEAARRNARITGSEEATIRNRIEVLKDHRTIRFGSGRATGASKWIMDHLAANVQDTVVFTKDKGVADQMLQSWIANALASTPVSLLRAITGRVLPQYAVRHSPGHPPPEVYLSTHKAPRYIIVSEASNHLHFFVKELYRWIAETAEPDPVIILVG